MIELGNVILTMAIAIIVFGFALPIGVAIKILTNNLKSGRVKKVKEKDGKKVEEYLEPLTGNWMQDWSA